MADYRRMVSYMYQYEDGVKKKNIGFARVEARGGQFKITLHMQLLGQLDSIFPTYLIQRGNNNLELIYLGDSVLKNQVMDSRLFADENNIKGSGYALSDMGGILLFLNDKVFFATEWDDKPVVAKEVLEALKPKPKKQTPPKEMVKMVTNFREEAAASVAKPQEERLEEELNTPSYMLPGGWKMVERQHNDNQNRDNLGALNHNLFEKGQTMAGQDVTDQVKFNPFPTNWSKEGQSKTNWFVADQMDEVLKEIDLIQAESNHNKTKQQEIKQQETDLQEIELQETKLQETKQQETELQQTKLQELKQQETELQETELQQTKLQESKQQESKLQESKQQETKQQEMKQQEMKQQETNLQETELQQTYQNEKNNIDWYETGQNNDNSLEDDLDESFHDKVKRINAYQTGKYIDYGKVNQNEAHQNEINQNVVNQNRLNQNRLNQNRLNQNRLNQNKVIQNEIKQSEVKQNEVKQNEVKQNEIKQNEIKQNEIKQNEIKQNEIKQNEDKIQDNTDFVNQDAIFNPTESLNATEYSNDQSNGQLKQSNEADPSIRMEEPEAKVAKHFFDNYPLIYPFEEDDIIRCVKIEPKDIGLLPKEIWSYSNNSFLMHGFYCYHHLIFAKIRNRSGYRYILGVPGIYHGREQFMARMFGFENFKSVRKRELQQGDFGYWYFPVYL